MAKLEWNEAFFRQELNSTQAKVTLAQASRKLKKAVDLATRGRGVGEKWEFKAGRPRLFLVVDGENIFWRYDRHHNQIVWDKSGRRMLNLAKLRRIAGV